MDELPQELQELVLKFATKSITRMLFYTNEQAEAYQKGIEDMLEFTNEMAELYKDDNENDIGRMGMDEFNQFMKEQLDKGDS